MMSVVLYPQADEAIAEILAYTNQQYGFQQAENYAGDIKKAFSHLCEFPYTGKPHPMIAREMRTYMIGKHIIIYRIVDEALHVITLLHQSMDIATRIEKLARVLYEL